MKSSSEMLQICHILYIRKPGTGISNTLRKPIVPFSISTLGFHIPLLWQILKRFTGFVYFVFIVYVAWDKTWHFFFCGTLRGHIKTVHEGYKDFKCDSCGKSFTEAGYLRKHIKTIHKGHRDFKCDSCGKSITQAVKLGWVPKDFFPREEIDPNSSTCICLCTYCRYFLH